MAKRQVRCEYPRCNKVFFSKVNNGVALDNFCKGCRNRIHQKEMRVKAQLIRKRRAERNKKGEKNRLSNKRGAQAPTPHLKKRSKRELPKIRGRTPEQIRDEIRFLEHRRAVELPRKRKDNSLLNARINQAEDILAKAIKNLYEELEVAERLGIKGHGKKSKN